MLVGADHEMKRDFEQVAAGVHVLPDLPTVPRTYSPLRLARYAATARRLADEIARIGRKIDAGLVYTVNEAFPPGALAGRRLGVPTLTHVLGMTMFSPPWVGGIWSRLLRRTSDHVIACQDVIAVRLQRSGFPRERLTIVYNAVDIESLRRRASQTPPRLEGELRIGMVAGMDPRKGHLDLTRAAARVIATHPSAHFYVIGDHDGPDPAYGQEVRNEIDRLGIRDNFHLVGRVDDPMPWVQAMDIYAIPSLSEAMAVAGVEAMALGRPIVATNVGGNPVLVVDGHTGLLAAPRDPRDLADKLLRLAADPDIRRRFGAAGARRGEERFAIEPNAERLNATLTSLLD